MNLSSIVAVTNKLSVRESRGNAMRMKLELNNAQQNMHEYCFKKPLETRCCIPVVLLSTAMQHDVLNGESSVMLFEYGGRVWRLDYSSCDHVEQHTALGLSIMDVLALTWCHRGLVSNTMSSEWVCDREISVLGEIVCQQSNLPSTAI